MVLRREASFDLARRVQGEGAPLGEVFAFMSGLYFRGKLAYARAFAPRDIHVITPSDGLVHPDTVVTLADLTRFADHRIDVAETHYREALERDARALAKKRRGREVVLLGSIATDKYSRVLLPIFGDSLHYPLEFRGRGDMSRGSLLLRSVAAGRELEYGRLMDHPLPKR